MSRNRHGAQRAIYWAGMWLLGAPVSILIAWGVSRVFPQGGPLSLRELLELAAACSPAGLGVVVAVATAGGHGHATLQQPAGAETLSVQVANFLVVAPLRLASALVRLALTAALVVGVPALGLAHALR
jgi:hypothetical protein